MILINPKLSRSTVPFLIPLPTKQLRLIITRSLSRQKPVLLFLFCGSMVCGEFILTAFLICVTNYRYTSFQMINTSAVNTYGFLPDSMMLLIHSLIQSTLSAECMWITGISARVFFEVIFSLIASTMAVERMCMTQVHARPYFRAFSQQYLDFSFFYLSWRSTCLCQSIQSNLLVSLSPWPNPQPTDVNLIRTPSKNAHLFLTVQLIFIRTYSRKTS